MECWIKEAAKRPGELFPVSVEERLEDMEFSGRSLSFATAARFEGSVSSDGKGFGVKGIGSVSFLSSCARCGKSFEEPFSFPMEARFFRPGFMEEQEDCYSYEGDSLELKEAFLENLFLQMPLVSFCKEDCAGLCPVCGTNLNEKRCNCAETKRSNPFDVLRALSFENKEV